MDDMKHIRPVKLTLQVVDQIYEPTSFEPPKRVAGQ